MLKPGFRAWLLVATLVCLVSSVGCGSKKGTPLTGKVLLPDKVKLDTNDTATVRFVSDQKGGPGAVGKVNPSDLTFTVEVPPGSYKVGAEFVPYPGGKANDAHHKALKNLSERFDAENSKMTYTVTSDSNQTITVNLKEGKVTSP